jgi:hypothetical protein
MALEAPHPSNCMFLSQEVTLGNPWLTLLNSSIAAMVFWSCNKSITSFLNRTDRTACRYLCKTSYWYPRSGGNSIHIYGNNGDSIKISSMPATGLSTIRKINKNKSSTSLPVGVWRAMMISIRLNGFANLQMVSTWNYKSYLRRIASRN